MKKLILFLILLISTFAIAQTKEIYEKQSGYQVGKFPLTLPGLQQAINSLPNDSGVVYIAYPGIDTTGLGAVPANVFLRGWLRIGGFLVNIELVGEISIHTLAEIDTIVARGLRGVYGGGVANIVEDTTPQLGGALDLNDKDIGNTTPTFTLTPTEFSYTDALTSNAQDQLTALFDSIVVLRSLYMEVAAGVDSFPDQFTFTDKTGKNLSTVDSSNSQPLKNFVGTIYPHINSPLSGDGLKIYHSGWGAWTTGATAVEGDSIKVKLTTSGSYLTAKTLTLHVSNKTDIYSVTTKAQVPPSPPTNFVATPISSSAVTLSWTAPSAHNGGDSIRVYRGGTSINDTTALVEIGRTLWSTTSYTGNGTTGLTPNTVYWFATKSVDTGDTLSIFSNRDSAKTFVGGVTPFATLDFEEGTAADWTYAGANDSYSADAAHNLSSFGMRITGTSLDVSYKSFTATDSIYVQFWIKVPTATTFSEGWSYSCYFSPENNDDHSYFGGNVEAANQPWSTWLAGITSSVMEPCTTNFVLDVWHEITLFYKKGTGTNSQHRMWVDGVNCFDDITGADNDHLEQMTRFNLGILVQTATGYVYYDDIRLYDRKPF